MSDTTTNTKTETTEQIQQWFAAVIPFLDNQNTLYPDWLFEGAQEHGLTYDIAYLYFSPDCIIGTVVVKPISCAIGAPVLLDWIKWATMQDYYDKDDKPFEVYPFSGLSKETLQRELDACLARLNQEESKPSIGTFTFDGRDIPTVHEQETARNALWKKLDVRIDSLELSTRIRNILRDTAWYYLGDIVVKNEDDFKYSRMPGFGKESLKELKAVLNGFGLYLSMTNTQDWQRPEDRGD